MSIYQLIPELIFPPIEEAEKDGLLAVGGDLAPERVLLALSLGIFPWFDDSEYILWWSPDPRYVIFPNKAKISKSTRRSAKKYHLKINTNFLSVISACASTKRPSQEGTWITVEIQNAYNKLNEYGYAYSFETYSDNVLVGGLYGVLLGKIFIGESMFSHKSDASKVAFMGLVEFCLNNDIKIIDCQFYTPHLESLGGEFISRKEYSDFLSKFVKSPFVKK
ncbi:MAG: leucyl/phenylalanyl-tRNA--protein transferase [Bacteroidales bacterium]|nr:leucyl/phenylalanyl-tRNA--protein transferase [Bacteroidales bacterium]MDD4217975.1 leucyl/phenylalanyl-tRNA--protein transferase [Bacteroidales bacterium]MDY0143301.1 leucyl/phenylalanyl-tRNA--protein transferase [Bacteroidales bacterium]